MRELALKNGGFTLVDDEDFEYLSQWSWTRSHHGYVIRYAARNHTIWMHREIMQVPKGDKRLVDHKNGDKADNRRSNLRLCTRTENNRNRAKSRKNTSGHKGVFWKTDRSRWVAKFRQGEKVVTIGFFREKEDAIRAYQEAIVKAHGEFACFDR